MDAEMDRRVVIISDIGSTEMKRQPPCLGFWSSSGKEATVIRLVVQQGEEEETLTLSRGVRGSDIGRMACRMLGKGWKTSRYWRLGLGLKGVRIREHLFKIRFLPSGTLSDYPREHSCPI